MRIKLFFAVLLILPFFVLGQNASLEIFYGSDNIIKFCSDSIAAAPDINIKGDDGFDVASEGIKISIANHRRGEDLLVYNGPNNLTAQWNDNYGYLEIKGIGTSSEYEEAVKQVYYKNLKAQPTNGTRSLSVTLIDADYLPYTTHFYRYVSDYKISWEDARDSAAAMVYNGLEGYLATITSSVENDFIWSKIDGVGWIGGTDKDQEGVWKWVTGPPAEQVQFWKGAENGSRVNGMYSNWSSGEPNNVTYIPEGEDFAHINQDPGKAAKTWNDLRSTGETAQYYIPQGFIVEFGGMPDDPPIRLSASIEIEINKIPFADEREFTICQNENVVLNMVADGFEYSWSPNNNISDRFKANPSVSPDETTTYVATGTFGECIDTASFTVNVNPIPIHMWDKEIVICEEASTTIDPGSAETYLWENGETTRAITVSDEDWYSVQLTNEFNCSNTDSTQLKWSIIPEINFEDLDTLVCGSKHQKLNITFEKENVQTIVSSFEPGVIIANADTKSPYISVSDYGKYGFEFSLEDQYQCRFKDTINIEFHNQPTAQFQIDEAECEGYNLRLYYTGLKVEDALFDWYSTDSLYFSGINVDTMVIPLGFGLRNRTVGLKINEQGCVDSFKLPVTVTPILDFWTINPEACTPHEVEFDYSASESVESFFWIFGDGGNSTLDKPSHLYTNSTVDDKTFDVSLRIVSDEGCENTGIIEDAVTVHPIPAIDFDIDETKCYDSGTLVSFVGSATEKDTFLWEFEHFEPFDYENPGITPGPFTIYLTSKPQAEIGLSVTSLFGCKTTQKVVKNFKRKPEFQVAIDTFQGCPPLDLAMSVFPIDGIDQVTYTWNFGGGHSGSGTEVDHTYSEPGFKNVFDVYSSSTLTGCKDTLVFPDSIFVYPVPNAAFTATPEVALISNPLIQFDNQSEGAEFYNWDFDDLTFSEELDPSHSFPDMGFYDVLLTSFNNFGCFDTVNHRVAIAFDKLFPPNAFSPNSQLEEDREFRIYAKGVVEEGYLLEIFNRWGEIIFATTTPQIGWDGKMKDGNFAPAGVYMWVIQYNDFIGKHHKQQGAVTLLF